MEKYRRRGERVKEKQIMNTQTCRNIFASVEAKYKNEIMAYTWGHLAPKKNKKYKGRIVYAIGCFGTPNPEIIFCEFNDLDSSPWFYDALHNFIYKQDYEAGCIYEFLGFFKNYNFVGTLNVILNTNK